MKLIYYKALRPCEEVEHGRIYFCVDGFWRTILRLQRCSQLIPQPGTTANGRRRPGRMCKNEAKYATYTGASEEIHQWLDPLCTQHHRARMKRLTATPTEEN